MSVSKLQFLSEKLANFKKYLGSIIPSHEMVNSFDVSSQENLIKFTQFVVLKVKPSKDNLDILIDSIMKEHKVEVSLSLEQRTKIKRYFEMFCEIID
jgi:Asp-tRNA(Asn)/Glu-tRNA(Gln) amidotransferase C subunit